MEAIGERPEQYGGNVVVPGRAGVASQPAPSGFTNPAAGKPGSFNASSPYASAHYDDGAPLSPGWPLQAVPTETAETMVADAESAGSAAGPADADAEPAAFAEAESQPAPPQQADSAVAAPSLADSEPVGSVTGPWAADSLRAGEPLGLAELGRLVAQAAAAAPSILAGASYVEAANYAAGVEEISRTVEYLQVLSAGTVDRGGVRLFV